MVRNTNAVLRSLALACVFCTAAFSAFAAGVADRSFGTDGSVRMPIGQQSILIDILFVPGGKIAAVSFSDYGVLNIARFNSNGQPDTTFGTQGLLSVPAPNFRVYDAAMLADGKILLAGSHFPGGNAVDFFMARLNPDGSPDATFGNAGIVSINQGSFDVINRIALQPDGKIVGAGYTSDAGGFQAVLRLNANGSLDPTFGGGILQVSALPPRVTASAPDG